MWRSTIEHVHLGATEWGKRMGLQIDGASQIVLVDPPSHMKEAETHAVVAGIDERPEDIGATAIEQLGAMIQRGDKGLPTAPR